MGIQPGPVVSTQEDREWDERQEYGYSHPLDPFARHSAILADREDQS
jgi:hypothetical protein